VHPSHGEAAFWLGGRGFSKTAFEYIAKRANLSRTLLYRIFKGKEEIFQALFVDWLVSCLCCGAGGEGACQPLRALIRMRLTKHTVDEAQCSVL